MKEVTIEQLLEFRNIYNKLNDLEVCLSTAIKLYQLKIIADATYEVYSLQMSDIINKYGQLNENNQLVTSDDGVILISPDKIEDCQREFELLRQTKITVEVTISSNEFEGISEKFLVMKALCPFIEV